MIFNLCTHHTPHSDTTGGPQPSLQYSSIFISPWKDKLFKLYLSSLKSLPEISCSCVTQKAFYPVYMLRSHLFQVNWSGVCASTKLLLVWLFAGHIITAKQQVTCWLEDDHRSRWQRSVSNLQFLALASDVSCSSDIPICTNYNETSTSVFSTKKLKIALINVGAWFS